MTHSRAQFLPVQILTTLDLTDTQLSASLATHSSTINKILPGFQPCQVEDRENFINFSRRESLKSYNTPLLVQPGSYLDIFHTNGFMISSHS
jgi:hypothetical protein